MNRKEYIEIYEFKWWSNFFGHLFCISASLFLVWIAWQLHNVIEPENYWRLYPMIFPALLYSITWLPDCFGLFAVPKCIYFKEDCIIVLNYKNIKKIYTYEMMTQLVIKYNYRRLFKWRFRAIMYFPNAKIRFNPDHLPEFSKIIDRINDNGMGHKIQWN